MDNSIGISVRVCFVFIDGFHSIFLLGNWRPLHHHAACWLVNIHITQYFCPPVSMVKDVMESVYNQVREAIVQRPSLLPGFTQLLFSPVWYALRVCPAAPKIALWFPCMHVCASTLITCAIITSHLLRTGCQGDLFINEPPVYKSVSQFVIRLACFW